MKKILLSSLCASMMFAGAIKVSEPYVKQTTQGMKNTALFMQIQNTSDKPIKLINAKEHTLGGATEIHTHVHEDGMMKMIKIPSITIEPHSTTMLKPKSYHIMVIGINKAVKEDTKADLTLYFDNGETIDVKNIHSKPIKHQNHNHQGGHDHHDNHEHKHHH